MTETAITSERRELYDTRGYFVWEQALCPAEITLLREATDRAIEKKCGPYRRTTVFIKNLGEIDPVFRLLAIKSEALEILRDVFGDAEAYYDHLTLVWPDVRITDGGWHKDKPPGSDPDEPGARIAYYLTDVSRVGLGNTRIHPGTQRERTLPRDREPVHVVARPGDALVYDRRLWHSSGDNLGPEIRKAVFIGYKLKG